MEEITVPTHEIAYALLNHIIRKFNIVVQDLSKPKRITIRDRDTGEVIGYLNVGTIYTITSNKMPVQARTELIKYVSDCVTRLSNPMLLILEVFDKKKLPKIAMRLSGAYKIVWARNRIRRAENKPHYIQKLLVSKRIREIAKGDINKVIKKWIRENDMLQIADRLENEAPPLLIIDDRIVKRDLVNAPCPIAYALDIGTRQDYMYLIVFSEKTVFMG